MFNYSPKLLDHFRHPRNYGRMNNPDGIGREGNPRCGDIIELYLKIKDGKIADIKFLTFGCVAAIGIASILTEMVKGKSIEEAKKLTSHEVLKEIGDIPSAKFHCSVLGIRALYSAIENYEAKKSQKGSK